MGWELTAQGSRALLKWVSFVAAIWIMTCVGTEDTFPIISPVLKAVLNYDQFQLSTLAGAKETGKGFGLVAGVFSFLVPLWVMLAVSIVESILGFGFLWLVVSERIAPPSYKLMYVMVWIAGNSITWMSTAALVVSIQNFPFNRGTVVGILKGIQTLSAAIYLQLGNILLRNNVEHFLLLLALLPASSCLVGIAFLQRVPPVMSRKRTHDDRKTFTFVYASTMVLALYMLSYNISGALLQISPHVTNVYMLLLVLFVAGPIIVPIRSLITSCWAGRSEPGTTPGDDQISDHLLMNEAEDFKESAPLVADSFSHESQWMYDVAQANQNLDIISIKDSGTAAAPVTPVTSSSKKPEEAPGEPVNDSNGVAPSSSSSDIVVEGSPPTAEGPVQKPQKILKKLGTHHFTVKDAWGAKEFWLLFFSFFCGIGMSITLQLNMSQVGEALGYTNVSIFLTIFSVSSFFGRVLGGGVSELLIKLAAIPRPICGAIVQTIMVVCYFQLALAFPAALYVGTFFAGITAGVQMTIAIATASELFGLKFIGMLYNFLLLVYPLSGNLFSGVLVGKLYDYETHQVGVTSHFGSTMTVVTKWAETHRLPGLYTFHDDAPETCIGAHCFRWVFFSMSAVSALGVVLNIALHFRVRRLYRAWYWNQSVAAHVEEVPAAPLLISHS